MMDTGAEDLAVQGASCHEHEKVDTYSEDAALHESSRARMQTEKGLAYQQDMKAKRVSQLFRQIKSKTEKLELLMYNKHDQGEVRPEYKEWMSNYEDLIKENSEYCTLLSNEELQEYLENSWDSRDIYLKNFKVYYSDWETVQSQKKQAVGKQSQRHGTKDSENMTSISRITGRGSRPSIVSEVSSARFKAEQEKAALAVKIKALKRRQEIEMAKLKLRLEEEELNLTTELDIVLDEFESQSNTSLRRDSNSVKQLKNGVSIAQPNNQSNLVDQANSGQPALNENAHCFVPESHNQSSSVKVQYNKHSCNSSSCQSVPVPLHVNNNHSVSGEGDRHCVNNRSENIMSGDNVLLAIVRQLKRPSPEIKRFSGEPADYRKFIRQFNTKVAVHTENDDERMSYLEQFTIGEANKVVSGFSHLPAEQGYPTALKKLQSRYGDVHLMAHSFINKALEWPCVRPDNPKALDDFSILLVECENAVKCIQAVKVLEYPDNMRKLVGKLPFYLHDRWRNIVRQTSDKGETVQFSHLVRFVKMEAKKVMDPMYGKEALSQNVRGTSTKIVTNHTNRSKGSFATEVSSGEPEQTGRYRERDKRSTAVKFGNQETKRECIYCSDTGHLTDKCKQLSSLPLSERTEFVKSKGLCYGCLKRGHQSRDCRHRSTCDVCKRRHPTCIHDENRVPNPESKHTPECANFAKHAGENMRSGKWGQCTMTIVPVKVRLRDGIKVVQTYAFMDPGSTVTFCSESLARQLGASGPCKSITLDTMGKPYSMKTYLIDGLKVNDLDMKNEIDLPVTYTKDTIPVSKNHIPTTDDISRWDHLKDISLPEIDADIGLLIGNNVADAYTPFDVKTGPAGSPYAARTMLGWVVWNVIRDAEQLQGDISCSFSVNKVEVKAISEVEQLKHLDRLVRQTINMDFPERLIDDKKEHSQEDIRLLASVSKSVTYRDGHYCIGLPFKAEDIMLPDNRSMALKRLDSLKHKLQRNSEFNSDYKEFMSKIMSEGYVEQVPEEDLQRTDGRVWYIPHHAVYHPRKPNKIRVVFDCAAMYLGASLNSALLQGPDLTNSLMGVLLRFRQEEIAIMGDIATMFYQVQVPREDRDCLRFFWWPNANLKEQPVAYRLRVHPFGAVSSPSCSSFALKQTVEDNGGSYGEASCEIVKRSFYVDDFLVSVGTEQEAAHLIKSTTALCKEGGFHLTKWVSNNHDVVQTVPTEERAKDIRELSMENQNLPNERALGFYWFVESDSLGFKVNLPKQPATRRGILSITSSVYDPLGIAAPFVLKAKILLQSLCRRDIGWDKEIQGEDLRIWNQWLDEVKDLDQLKIRRCYKPLGFGQVVSCQLHIFADASDVGYGVAAYLRLCNESGRISCSLVTGKARVAPLKNMTIPRMELTAANIAVRVGKLLTRKLDCDIDGTYYWTDSMTVLRYLANESCRFKTFVANRIAIIRDASCLQQWKYVNTKSNPADCATRGQSVKKFVQCSIWFEGPAFLYQPETEWPPQDAHLTKLPDNDVEVKKTVLTTTETSISPIDRLLEHYSDWTRLIRAVAWILVWMKCLQDRLAARKKLKQESVKQELEQQEPNPLHRSQKPTSDQSKVQEGFLSDDREGLKHTRLTTENIESAERALMCYVQQKHWKDEIKLLKETEGKQSSAVKKSSSLRKLDPKLVDGLLRVGGQIGRADLDFESKHQVLIPKDSPISRLILQHIHKSVGHLGKNSILAELRRHYWIIGAPSIIKGIVSRCVICRRYQALAEQQKMASLPQERLALNEPPFSKVGMDYFGPFEVKRGRSMVKRYGVIFTCLTSRAVHLELAHSLDTDSCINAIRRFSARRGSVKSILSDNGTNLVGAEREMREEMKNWNQQKIHDNLLQKGISWHFNPPAGSHFGGIWEHLIRSTRKILYSLMREQNVHLSDESLQTLLCEVEAIMNGRPLTECPNSPNDLDVLTPNHLLLQRSGESLPLGVCDRRDKYPVRQWRQVQYFADVFWNRWSKEYLPLLQERQKWTHPKRNVTVGDIVLVVDSTPRNSWALGRVLEVVKDKNGFVRSAKLKTKTSTLVRPVTKLCLLVEGNVE